MSTLFNRRPATVLLFAMLTVMVAACAVYGGGYGGGGMGYYEPYGNEYGAWTSGYQVAPYRSGYAVAGRGTAPSLPSGGGHGGGGGYGGGGHGGGGGRR